MLDFVYITAKPGKTGIDISPHFRAGDSKDLMTRGGDFYAIWDEEKGLWSTQQGDAVRIIDREIDIYAEKHKDLDNVRVHHLWDCDAGSIDKWRKYCKQQMWDNFHPLDEKIIFSNTPVSRDNYASHKLNYPLEKGKCEAYDRIMSVLYSEEERHKIEWVIGAIISGDSKTLQKFVVLYGPPGTGKSTAINIIQMLFQGYYVAFDSKTLGSASHQFALEAFRDNPLIAIQHDGDLSHIEDNTRINSLVSHEKMAVNVKNKSVFSQRFNTFLIMGTNKPVRITDSKSGIIRRLIDIMPTGNKVPVKEYDILMSQIEFELGAIAYKCLEVYKADPGRYDNYIPLRMMEATNDFYNFMLESYMIFKRNDGATLKSAWEMYQTYCNEAKVAYPLPKRAFTEEMKSYFREFYERFTTMDGDRVRSWYSGFRTERFESDIQETVPETSGWLHLDKNESLLDKILKDCPAQYANDDKPVYKWDNVNTKLSDILTSRVHYVKPPENHIVIDFDISENGEKSLEKNLEAANKWAPTYAEVSKGGRGLHLHYIYTGDVTKLSRIFDDNIEIKVFTGKSSLRRRVSLCNDIPVATLNSGLPEREVNNMVDFECIKNEKMLRSLVRKNLNREILPNTKPSIDLIVKDLQAAYDSGIEYDISDMRPYIFSFAASSTHQSDYCIKQIEKMQFKSKDKEKIESDISSDREIAFYDIEIFPNLFLVNFKLAGDHPVVRMINPSIADIENLLAYRLIGFNCRRYDNHIIYARLMGYTVEQLYSLSQRIINEGKGFFREAYDLSYTDVYDFSSKKQSLKKFEIELGIHHQELGLPWDKPVPEDMWETVAKYCDNDVIATEAVFNARKADFIAREVLADVAEMNPNTPTNTLTAKIIFGGEKHPQSRFNYRFMGDMSIPHNESDILVGFDKYTVFDKQNRPLFPGYTFENGKSVYRDEEIGEGGYVYAEPGIYHNVALLDIASMHPASLIAENLLGDEYTQNFRDIRDARIAIKHKDFDKARTMLGGKLAKYLDDESKAADLAQALKIAINSVYGLTSAKFDNAFRDIRNVDNIVAKRGALFMVNLKHEVQNRGFTVAHIKTDSIKIPNATNEIIQFVMDYGKMYGYSFEHEATYEKMCLVNDAVYVAKYAKSDICEAWYGYVPEKNQKKSEKWTATGTQFQVPYVFKSLFSHEEIIFSDMCETKSVASAIYLDMNEGLPEGEHDYRFIGKVGSFCPIKTGCGGGLLMRENGDKYAAVTGTKGYRWLEAETVLNSGWQDNIDKSYYARLVDEAVDTIGKYGDPEQFMSDISVEYPPDDDLPF